MRMHQVMATRTWRICTIVHVYYIDMIKVQCGRGQAGEKCSQPNNKQYNIIYHFPVSCCRNIIIYSWIVESKPYQCVNV